MRILVTGGAGFLGSHLCKALLEKNHQVICLDNFYTGRKENIVPLQRNELFSVIEHDICDFIDLDNIDAIYHLACPASPIHYQRDPIKTNKTSVLGTLNLLELAKRENIPMLFTSTSEVYGDPLQHPQTENYWGHVNPIGKRACYDEGKRCAEAFCMDYHRQYNVDIKIARLFNTYGPNMCPQDGRIISNFITQILQNKPITIYGDGKQTRSFCYVQDTVNALMKLLHSAYHQPINIGNPVEYTIKDIAHLLENMLQKTATLEFLPLPADDPKQRKPDISLAKEILDWAPQTDLKNGLQQTITYFKNLCNYSPCSKELS